MEIYHLYESYWSDKLLAKVVVFDDKTTVVKWQKKKQSISIYTSLDDFKEEIVEQTKLYLNKVF